MPKITNFQLRSC